MGDVANAGKSYLMGDLNGMFKGLSGIGKRVTNPGNRDKVLREKSSPADVIMFSGYVFPSSHFCVVWGKGDQREEHGAALVLTVLFCYVCLCFLDARIHRLQQIHKSKDSA